MLYWNNYTNVRWEIMKKILNLLLLAFSIIVLICPLSFILINIKTLLISFLLLLLIVYIIRRCKRIKHSRIILNDKIILPLIFVCSFIIKLIFVIVFNKDVVQTSDFGTAYSNILNLKINTLGYSVFTHWVYYILFFSKLVSIFGSNLNWIPFIHIIIISLSSVLIYLISNEIINNKKYSLFATLLYILWPINNFYIMIFTQEHINILFVLIYTYCFIKLLKIDTFKLKDIFLVIVLIITLSISSFFKNFSLIFMLAFFFSTVLMVIKNKNHKNFLICLLILIITFGGYKVIINLMYDNLDNNYFSHKVVRNVSPCYLNVGLNSFGNGFYNDKLYNDYFNTLTENNYDYKKTNEIINYNLKKDIKKNYGLLPEKFFNKLKILFGNDNGKISYVSESLKNSSLSTFQMSIINFVFWIDNIYYYLIVILMVFALVQIYKEKNINAYFLYIAFFGSIFLILLIETQNRYKYCLEPIMCIIATFGLKYLLEFYVGRKKKNEKIGKI